MHQLIVVSGLPGSGKSTLAEALSQELRAPIFSVDPIESATLKAGIPKSFETGLAAYLVVEAQAEIHLRLGFAVIIDAVCPVTESRDMWRDLAAHNDVGLKVIECQCKDEDLHRERLSQRVRNLHGFPETTWADIEKLREEYTPWEEPKLVVDTSTADVLTPALAFVGHGIQEP